MTPVEQRASTTLNTNQVSVTSAGVLIVAARDPRNSVTVENLGTVAVYLGNSGVTTTTGFLLPGVVGASVTFPFAGAVYGVVASTSQSVAFAETY